MWIQYPHQADGQESVRITILEKHALHDPKHLFADSYFRSDIALSRPRLSFKFKFK
jgi:hypothetical protein